MRLIDVLRLRSVEARACRRAGRLAGELAHAEPGECEEVLAELEFDRWLAESCADALEPL